jgi:hypothetical protein
VILSGVNGKISPGVVRNRMTHCVGLSITNSLGKCP